MGAITQCCVWLLLPWSLPACGVVWGGEPLLRGCLGTRVTSGDWKQIVPTASRTATSCLSLQARKEVGYF